MESLYELLSEKRRELVHLWLETVRRTLGVSGLNKAELEDRIPFFIEDLLRSLHPSALPLPDDSKNAREHGVQRLRLGFNISEVVREYGTLFHCVLALAARNQVLVGLDELFILNQTVTTGLAEAASEYVRQRDLELRRSSQEHIGFLAHELRNPLMSARMSCSILRKRQQLSGRAADTLERSLVRMGELVDNALTSAWLQLGAQSSKRQQDLRALMDEVIDDSAVEAEWRQIRVLLEMAEAVTMEADPRLLRSAVGNALRNAVKFSREAGTVTLRVSRSGERVLIEVEDECGGLPQGKADELLHPFVQKGRDRSGFGLGLAIARDATEAHNGTIGIENRPGKGCIVRFDLPAATTASSD